MKANLAENPDGQYCPAWSGRGPTTNLHYCLCLEKERRGGGGVAWDRKVSGATLTLRLVWDVVSRAGLEDMAPCCSHPFS